MFCPPSPLFSLLSSPPKSNNRSLHQSHFKPPRAPPTQLAPTNTACPHQHRRALSPSPPTHNHHRRSFSLSRHSATFHLSGMGLHTPWYHRHHHTPLVIDLVSLKAISVAAESKREEEKAKGVNPENGTENPDIVPFEDNEEEEEEDEESEEDESYGQAFGAVAQGRGRGRGMMWPPHMPFARGARPFPGMRGFPPVMDGFSYGSVTHDGFPVPDVFGVGPRPFPPYGPRFPSDFAGPASGMMFHGRPPGGGFGMMMGPGRTPFMGGMGIGAAAAQPRAGRPVGLPPVFWLMLFLLIPVHSLDSLCIVHVL